MAAKKKVPVMPRPPLMLHTQPVRPAPEAKDWGWRKAPPVEVGFRMARPGMELEATEKLVVAKYARYGDRHVFSFRSSDKNYWFEISGTAEDLRALVAGMMTDLLAGDQR